MPDPAGGTPFEGLLQRLAPDRAAAGERYLALRRRLVAVFDYRGCRDSEALADETLERAARRLQEIGSDFVGSDPTRFIYGVAWNVARESFRRPVTVPLPEKWESRVAEAPPHDDGDLEQDCLEGCLRRLAAAERELVLGYHQGEGSDRIQNRAAMARGLGLSANALRLKIHRLTAQLRECVLACVERGGLEPSGAAS
jgi:DNA-directed RNA polymerase specialized sigma24 family protein